MIESHKTVVCEEMIGSHKSVICEEAKECQKGDKAIF
jgi:uncharacterized Fe-S cluster protein YjdI